jgi:hypothetical protein
MIRDQIVDGIIELLRQHQNKLRGTIHQEPYKGDFFGLFASAFNAGLLDRSQRVYLSADALTDIIVTRAPEVVDSKTPYTTWSNFRDFWREWDYAWSRTDQITR